MTVQSTVEPQYSPHIYLFLYPARYGHVFNYNQLICDMSDLNCARDTGFQLFISRFLVIWRGMQFILIWHSTTELCPNHLLNSLAINSISFHCKCRCHELNQEWGIEILKKFLSGKKNSFFIKIWNWEVGI